MPKLPDSCNISHLYCLFINNKLFDYNLL